MASDINERVILKQSREEIFANHSSPAELLERFYQEEETLPEEFLETASPREPDDILIIRGTMGGFERRTWKEELELSDEAFHQREFADLPAGTVPLPEFKDFLSEDHLSIVSHEYGTCTGCDGTPRTECDSCGGAAQITCSTCGGDGATGCSECGGTGSQECPTCQSTGDYMCPSCDGDGERIVESGCPNCTDGIIRTKETCSQCQGDGTVLKQGETVSCPRCSGGWFSTSGVVAVENACPECGGRGATRRRTTCTDCAGEGRLDCDQCNSAGTVDCEGCEATGTMSCQECSGTGEYACEDCEDGVVVCSVCDADGETHKLVVRHTKIVQKQMDLDIGELPYGISDLDWESIEPYYLEYEEKHETTVTVEPASIDLDVVGDGWYVRVDSRYAAIRELTYDYGEQNFTVREVDGDLQYNQIPEPEAEGFVSRVKNLF